jgi:hypothetical protein
MLRKCTWIFGIYPGGVAIGPNGMEAVGRGFLCQGALSMHTRGGGNYARRASVANRMSFTLVGIIISFM